MLRGTLLHPTPAADSIRAGEGNKALEHLEALVLKATTIADVVEEAHTELGKLFEGPN